MGFGLLFMGYFLAFIVFIGHLAVCRAIGGAIMAVAAYKLRGYSKGFKWMLIASVFSFFFYGAAAALDALDYLGVVYAGKEMIATFISVADIPITFAFHGAMLMAIRSISRETDSGKLYFAASRNLIFYAILFVLQLVTLLPFSVARNMSVLSIVLSLVLAIFNLVLIFKCYAGICDSDDVDMEVRPSRIGFVNTFRDEQEKRRIAAEQRRAEKKRNKGEK